MVNAGAITTFMASLQGASSRLHTITGDIGQVSASADKLGHAFAHLRTDTSAFGSSLDRTKGQILAVNGDITKIASTAGKLGQSFAHMANDAGFTRLAKLSENATGKFSALAHASEVVQQRLSQTSPALDKVLGPLSSVVNDSSQLVSVLKAHGVVMPAFVDSTLNAAGSLIQMGNDFGPLLMNVASLVKGFAPELLGFLGELTATALPGLSAAFVSMGIAIETTPIGWIATAIAAFVGIAYLVYEYWTPIKHFFAGLWDSVVGAFKWAWNNIVPWIPGWNLVKMIIDHWHSIAGFFQSIWAKVAGVFVWVRNFMIGLWDIVVQKLMAVWRPIANFFSGIWNRVVAVFKGAGGHIKAWLTQLGQGAVKLLMGAWSKVTGFFKSIWDGVTGVFSAAWDRIKPIVDAVMGFAKWLLDITGISSAWNEASSGAEAIEKHGEQVEKREQAKSGAPGAKPRIAPPNPPKIAPPANTTVVSRTSPPKNTAPTHTAPHLPGGPRSGPAGSRGTAGASAGSVRTTGAVYASGPVTATGAVRLVHAPARVATPVRVRSTAAPRQAAQIPVKGSADIRVHFENVPSGAKVSTRVSGKNPPNVQTGMAFHN